MDIVLNIDTSTSNTQRIKVKGSWKKRQQVKRTEKKVKAYAERRAIAAAQESQTEEPIDSEKSSPALNPLRKTVKAIRKKQAMFKKVFQPNRKDSQKTKEEGFVSSIFTNNPSGPENASTTIDHSLQPKESNGIFGSDSFESLGLSPAICSLLVDGLKFEKPTLIQKYAIPALLGNVVVDENIQCESRTKSGIQDLVLHAQTGSGKTVAFLAPILYSLLKYPPPADAYEGEHMRGIGTVALILTPTRELASQIYAVLENMINKISQKDFPAERWIVPGLIVGGENKKSEKARLRKGVTILVGTPGRILDHMQTTQAFKLNRLKWLIFDESDRLLDLGFAERMRDIIAHLKKNVNVQRCDGKEAETFWFQRPWQKILSSATCPNALETMCKEVLFSPVYIHAESKAQKGDIAFDSMLNTPTQLIQKCLIVVAKQRLAVLVSLIHGMWAKSMLATKTGCKIIVFFSCCDSVDFYYVAFQKLQKSNHLRFWNNIPLFYLHGNQEHGERQQTYKKFSKANEGVLLCTDVAARGLDLPDVTRIIQFDAPTDISDYAHRAGRTARIGREGEAVLFLQPCELDYLEMLKTKGIEMDQTIRGEAVLDELCPRSSSISAELHRAKCEKKAMDVHIDLERAVIGSETLLSLAKSAFLSSVRAYATHPSLEKSIFHIKKLHLGHYAKSFALRETPGMLGKRKADDKDAPKLKIQRK